jgi:hypothetical protein
MSGERRKSNAQLIADMQSFLTAPFARESDYQLGWYREWNAALTALIAERDGLRAQIADAYRDRASSKSVLASVIAERNALKQRVAELEANPPADRDRELRERLVESALRGAGTGAARAVRSSMLTEAEAEALGRQAVWMADGAFDEMRKGTHNA